VLYQRYHAALHAFCVRNLDDKEEAADLVQDAFLKAWLALRRGFEPEAPYPWLLTIARNLCVSRHRARSSRIQALHLDESHDLGVTEEGPTDDLIELRSLLQRLPERQRRALLLHEVMGLPYGEVAAELNISYAAVATLVFRTRRTLAQGLAHGNAGEEKPRRSLGLGWLLGIGQRVNFVLGSGTPVKVAAALGVAPLVMLPSPVLNRGRDRGPVRAAATRHVGLPAPLDRALTVSTRMAAPNSSTRFGRVTVLATAAALTGTPPANEKAEAASPEGGGPTLVEIDSRTPPISDTGSPKPPESATTVPTSSPGAEDPSRASVPPVPSRQLAGKRDPNSSITAPPTDQGAQEEVNAPPADPASQGSGPPADPGSQAHSHGPPADPGSQGNGPPADPGSQGNGPPADPGSQGNGPPADPGSQGNGPLADPGSQAHSHGPPADPGSQGNGPPADPGSHAQSDSAPASRINKFTR
jgi:RNA polymerase sigma factor (sigma-70 family)